MKSTRTGNIIEVCPMCIGNGMLCPTRNLCNLCKGSGYPTWSSEHKTYLDKQEHTKT